MSPRTGRPKSEHAKDVVIRCRITKEFNERLEKFCEEKGTTKSEVMIKGIRQIMEQK